MDLPATSPVAERVRELPATAHARRLRVGERSGRALLEPAALLALVVLAAGVRLYHLTHLSLWLDEGFTLLCARLDWPSVVGFNGFYDVHPPLYFALTKAAGAVVAEPAAGRAVSAIAAIATIPVVAAIADRCLNRRAALVATAVLALSPLHLYFAQEGRPYALVTFLVAVSYLAVVVYLDRPGWPPAALYGAAVALAVYVEYSAAYALLPQAFLLVHVVRRHRREAAALVVAGGVAILAYVPWLTQAAASVKAANENERRESYLGTTPARIGESILSVLGAARANAFYLTSDPPPWDRLAILLPLTILAAVPLSVLGLRALLPRRAALLTIVPLLAGTILCAMLLSLISPGYEERTILPAVLGWALLAGAAFARPLSRWQFRIAGVSLALLLALSGLSVIAVYRHAEKTPWRQGAADLAAVAPLGIPVVSYSYGVSAVPLIEAYAPDLFDRVTHIPIRDGEMEEALNNDFFTDGALTRQQVLDGGIEPALREAGGDGAAFWFYYYNRTGMNALNAGFREMGYRRILHRDYIAIDQRLFLDLYVKPETTFGQPIAGINGGFDDNAAGWSLPAGFAEVETTPDGAQLVLAAATPPDAWATADVALAGTTGGLFVADVAVRADAESSSAVLRLSCLAADGHALPHTVSTIDRLVPANARDAIPLRAAALCPPATTTLRVEIGKSGPGRVIFEGLEVRG